MLSKCFNHFSQISVHKYVKVCVGCRNDDSIAQWMEALSALPKLCGSWHLQEAAAAIPIGADVRLRLVSQCEIDSSSKPCFEEEIIKCVF